MVRLTAAVLAFFLAGDQNPLHAHVIELRKHHERCGNDVSFLLLRGADHNEEWMALGRRGGAIADWLSTKRRPAVEIATPSPTTPTEAPPETPTETTPLSSRTATPTPHPRPPEPLPPRAGCGCEVGGGSGAASWLVAAGLLGLLFTRRHRARLRG